MKEYVKVSSFKNIVMLVLVALSFPAAAQVSATMEGKKKSKKTVQVIKITDTSLIPKNAKIIKSAALQEKRKIDSSRFIKRKVAVTDNRVKPRRVSHVRVDPAIYGKHTDFIVKYIANYHKNYGKRLTRMKRQHRSHFSFIENVFRKYKVPKELKALAVIESAMNFQAVSSVGARGPWQFMPETGRLLGLRVDSRVDERVDFYKSTKAAAKYLKRINRMFKNDWLLTVAGYNWGPGNITKALNRSKGKTYWDIKDRLPRETRNHVMAFIATSTYMDQNSNALSLGNAPGGMRAPKPNFGSFASSYDDVPTVENNRISFKKGQLKIAPSELDNIAILKVKGAYTIGVICKHLECDVTTLTRWNPTFDTDILSADGPIYLRIPVDKLERFILKKNKIVRDSRLYIDQNIAPKQ
jgi:membrane-bound lytic murein transglycosylase D